MKKISAIMWLGLVLISFISYSASLSSMNKTQIEQAFVNNTIHSIPVDNLNGKDIANTFSMFLNDKGHIIGKLSQKPKDEPQVDEGTYKIKNDGTLYIIWQHWDGAKKLCAHVFETKNAYIAVDCNNVFHTAYMKSAIRSGNHLLSK